MRIAIPSSYKPYKNGKYDTQHGRRVWHSGKWRAMPQHRWENTPDYAAPPCIVQDKEWYSETTEWFDSSEWIPSKEGIYQVSYIDYCGIKLEQVFYSYWNGQKFMFISGSFRNAEMMKHMDTISKVFRFRGIKDQVL